MVSKAGTSDVEVRVRSTVDQRKIPEWLGARLRLGAHRAGRLRRAIAVQGGLPDLPAVEVFPEVWRVKGDLVLGQAGAIQRDGEHPAVLLPAATVVQSDEELLRSVLVVQFYACISSMTHSGANTSSLSIGAPCGDPSDWFDPKDAARVKGWMGVKSDGLEVIAELLAKSLPTVEPPPDDKLVDVHLPDWIHAHVAPGRDASSSTRSAKDGQL